MFLPLPSAVIKSDMTRDKPDQPPLTGRNNHRGVQVKGKVLRNILTSVRASSALSFTAVASAIATEIPSG